MKTVLVRAYHVMFFDYLPGKQDNRYEPVTIYAIESRDLYILVTHQSCSNYRGGRRPITGGPNKNVEVGRLSHQSADSDILKHINLTALSSGNSFVEDIELPEAVIQAAEGFYIAQEKFRGHWSANFVLYAPDLQKWNSSGE